MTTAQADAARRRATQMLENFGDYEGAEEFDDMTAEEYADRKGIELVNPTRRGPRRRGHATIHNGKKEHRAMAKSKRLEECEDTIRDIYDLVQESGETRASQHKALCDIADLCVEAIPELNEDDEEEGDGDGDESDDEESDDE